MREIAEKHKNRLESIKTNIENAYQSFTENYKRYNVARNFVFVTTLSDDELSLLTALKKPKIEFNILEAYVSRLRGEFSKQEPALKIGAKDGMEVDPKLIEVVEGHVRYCLKEANKDGLEYHCYTDTLSGGFSAMKVFTDYTAEMSFHQDIYIKRVFDPTMVGFDPMATREDKSDGAFCFEIFPYRLDVLKEEYPNATTKGMSFHKGLGPFNWSYKVKKEEIVLVADYYEKKRTKKTICLLSDGQVLTTEEYNKFLEDWANSGRIEQAPVIVGEPRTTYLTKIVRYRVIQNEVLEYEETDYKRFPLIFVDGNSVLSKEGGDGVSMQITRPYIFHAMGAQRLKNFAGQTLANEIENMGPPKMAMPKDGIPPQYKEAYTDPQSAIIYIYNAFKNDDPNVALPPPIWMQRPQIPPDIAAMFTGADSIVMNILGSFDAQMAQLTEQQVSGKAIVESATLSNASAMPYVTSFLRGLQSAAQLIVDLIPLYYTTPRTIPVMSADGKKSYVKINQQGGVSMDYDADAIQISVEAGVSFNIQRDKALQQITSLMHTSKSVAAFFEDVGMDILLDNVEIRNVETLRERAEGWMMEQKKAKQQMMELEASKPKIEEQALQIAAQQVQSDTQLGMAKIQLEAAKEQSKGAIDHQKLEIEQQKVRVDLIEALAGIKNDQSKLGIEQQKAEDERIRTLLEIQMSKQEHHHDMLDKQFERAMRGLEMAHEIKIEDKKADAAMSKIVRGSD